MWRGRSRRCVAGSERRRRYECVCVRTALRRRPWAHSHGVERGHVCARRVPLTVSVHATMVNPPPLEMRVSEDPDDDKFLAAALARPPVRALLDSGRRRRVRGVGLGARDARVYRRRARNRRWPPRSGRAIRSNPASASTLSSSSRSSWPPMRSTRNVKPGGTPWGAPSPTGICTSSLPCAGR